MDSGAAKCGFTSGWISWVQTENFSAWHNQPIGTKQNGFGGLDARLTYGKDRPLVKHWGEHGRVAEVRRLRIRRPGAAATTRRRSSIRANARCT